MTIHEVLSVDDSDVDRYILKKILKKYDAGVNVLEAADGLSALQTLEGLSSKPKIIFLDLNMPRMNGFEFLQAYDKNNDEKSDVVVLTSSANESDRDQVSLYNCVKHYVVKPIAYDSLDTIFNT